MNEILKVSNLSVKINNNFLLKDINFSVNKGEIVGLLGHNGVGKSTIQRIIANREEPTSGVIYNLGIAQSLGINSDPIVYIPDVIVLIPNLTILENYNLITRTRKGNQQFFDKYIKVIRLDNKQRIDSLSKGNQELVQIITLLSLEANLYLLDEPFSAVDIFRRELIQKIIIDLSMRNEHSSVIITSHLINEIEPMLSRVLYLDEGQIAIDSQLEAVLEQSPSLYEYIKQHFGDKVGYDYV